MMLRTEKDETRVFKERGKSFMKKIRTIGGFSEVSKSRYLWS